MSQVRHWSESQAEAYAGLESAWREHRALDEGAIDYAGGLQWKTVKGRA